MPESSVPNERRTGQGLALLTAAADVAQENALPALAERAMAVLSELSGGGGELEILDRGRTIARAARGEGPFVPALVEPRPAEAVPAEPVPVGSSGRISIAVRLARALDDDERGAAAAFVRIVRAGAERIVATDRADRAARERREIVSMISHDLRTPLQTFAMGLDAIKLGAGPALAKIEPTLGRMKRSMDSMTRTIGEVVDASRIHDAALTVRFAPCPVEPVVAALRAEHEPGAQKKSLALETEVEPGLTLTCDRERLGQALGHLLSNAIRHAEKGSIRLLARRAAADRARFEVSDAGPGIEPEVRARLFEQLHRSDPGRSGGVGLGLFLVRGIADAHGGTTGVESEPGKGSTFWIELPLVARAPASERGTAGG